MNNVTSTHDLLTGIARATDGLRLWLVSATDTVVDLAGSAAVAPAWVAGVARGGPAPVDLAILTERLPGGAVLVAALEAATAGVRLPMLAAMLPMVARCEQFELDMESMNHGSMQLLEQVSMLGETLPKLSAAESEQEIATTGLMACAVATGVERALYVHVDQRTGAAEVLVHVELDARGRAVLCPYPLGESVVAVGGVIGEVLQSGDAVLLRDRRDLVGVAAESPESLARREVLGAAVTCDDGDRRVGLGVILLLDKVQGGYGGAARLGSEECQVALSFASMLGAVIGARQSAELGKELSMAQAIQAQILPAGPARVPGFDLAGDYRTSGEVGGDYFDYVPLADGRTLCVVADVSGHNLASGMMMVSARATLRTLAAVRTDPAQLFADLASGMFLDLTRTERFITAAGVALSPLDASVEIVNAGHNDLLLYRAADGTVTRLQSDSTVFGFLPNAEYDRKLLRLEAGDCLFLYTDGVTEATDANGDMFGEERLAQVLAGAASGTAKEIVAAVLAAVQEFRGVGERGDDVTVLAIQRTSLPLSGRKS